MLHGLYERPRPHQMPDRPGESIKQKGEGMYTGSNPAALRSRDYIVSSFLKLTKSLPLEEISVKRIMDESRLSRQTFYQIFDSKDEVIEYCMDRMLDAFLQDMQAEGVSDLCDTAALFFSFFEREGDFLRMMAKGGKTFLLQKKCREYLREKEHMIYHRREGQTGEEKQLAMTFIVCGMVGMLEQWLRTDSDMTGEDLGRLVCQVTNAAPGRA